ncbi:MAG TPA: hypothetical protein VF271_05455 [Rhodanobacteraceae bacterium]
MHLSAKQRRLRAWQHWQMWCAAIPVLLVCIETGEWVAGLISPSNIISVLGVATGAFVGSRLLRPLERYVIKHYVVPATD